LLRSHLYRDGEIPMSRPFGDTPRDDPSHETERFRHVNRAELGQPCLVFLYAEPVVGDTEPPDTLTALSEPGKAQLFVLGLRFVVGADGSSAVSDGFLGRTLRYLT